MDFECPCSFVYFNKCITPVGDGDNGGGCACVKAGDIWDTSVTYAQFGSESKTALKN